jgi:hypothetical protein
MPKTLTVETFDPTQDIKLTYPNFLFNVIPLLSRLVPEKSDSDPTKYSATKLLKSLSAKEKALYKFVTTTNYSQMSKTPQIREPSVSSAVPLILLAYKQNYNVSYNSWDRTDPWMEYLLPEKLRWLVSPLTVSIDLESRELLLSEFLTEQKSGIVQPRTAYKLSKTSNSEFNRLPAYQRMMLLQTWLYAPEIAHANMITNIYDWDQAPEVLPTVQTLAPW